MGERTNAIEEHENKALAQRDRIRNDKNNLFTF